jgi:Ca2+-binding EF-hand superfamily protein
MDSTKNVKIPFEILVEMVKNLDEELKEELFERVFFVNDTSPLSEKEKQLLKLGARGDIYK